MSTGIKEADVIENLDNVQFTKDLKLVASWLPPDVDVEREASSKDVSENEEDGGDLVPICENAGLGDTSKEKSVATDKLRERLGLKREKRSVAGLNTKTQSRRKGPRKEELESNSDEEEGRSSLFKLSKKSQQGWSDDIHDSAAAASSSKPSKKKATSFLDEALAERERKRQKKQKKKKQEPVSSN